jgi:hypothetical protein
MEAIDWLFRACWLGPAATEADVALAETRLDVSLPQDLRVIFSELDGVTGKYGAGLMWPFERIAADTVELRSNPDFPGVYMPFAALLFCAGWSCRASSGISSRGCSRFGNA